MDGELGKLTTPSCALNDTTPDPKRLVGSSRLQYYNIAMGEHGLFLRGGREERERERQTDRRTDRERLIQSYTQHKIAIPSHAYMYMCACKHTHTHILLAT